MASLSNIVYLSQTDYDTLISSGSVNGHTYSASNIYIVSEDIDGQSFSIVSGGTSLTLKDDAYYYFEANSTAYTTCSFGVVHMDMSSTNSKPILVMSANSTATSTSTLTNNTMIRLRLGRTAVDTYTAYIDVCAGSSSSLATFYATSGYTLKFWRLNL